MKSLSRGFRGEAPNVPLSRSDQRKSSRGAKRNLTVLGTWLFLLENSIRDWFLRSASLQKAPGRFPFLGKRPGAFVALWDYLPFTAD